MNRLERWILAWIDIAVALVSIVTLGSVYLSWSMDFCFWTTLRKLRKHCDD